MKVPLLMLVLVGCGDGEKKTWTSDPSNPQNVILEEAIRKSLKKPTGKLTKADLEKVRALDLGNTEITDAGLKEVAKLTQLTALVLWDCRHITDAGLKEVAKLKQLTFLDLIECKQITDTGLKEVARLNKLTDLSLNGTKVTKAGVAELKKALPNCGIVLR